MKKIVIAQVVVLVVEDANKYKKYRKFIDYYVNWWYNKNIVFNLKKFFKEGLCYD